MAVQVSRPSAVTPLNIQEAVEPIPAPDGVFAQLMGEPANVQTCPTLAVSPHCDVPYAPEGMKLTFKFDKEDAKLRNSWSAKPEPPTVSGGFVRFASVTLPDRPE